MTATGAPSRIVVLGAGYVGMNTARRLQSKLRGDEATITVVDPRSYMTYQPFLPEVAAGSLEPRHVVAPLRSMLDKCEVVSGAATGVDTDRKVVSVEVVDGHTAELGYDFLVVAPGSVSKTLPIPGLASQGTGFTNLGEAIYLRNHVLTQLDKAASTSDPALRRRLMNFVFVGGGYAGIEALGELEEMACFAVRSYYPDLLDVEEMRWVLVEAAERIMPEVSQPLADYTVELLRDRGIAVHLETTVKTMEDGHVALDDGTEFETETVVWTAGVSPHPLLDQSGLPLDERGRARCHASLEVEDRPGVFSAGDCAAVPDLTADEPGTTCAPSAQHAVRQAKRLGDNIVARLRGAPMKDYKHASAGSVAALGLHQGVAEIYGMRLKGWPAWALHRAYHLANMPTLNRRGRILVDWVLDVPFRRQVVALGELHRPRMEFVEEAAKR